jgi:hypothetical protein
VVLEHNTASEVQHPLTAHHGHLLLPLRHGLDGGRETGLLPEGVAHPKTLGVFGQFGV